MQDVGPSFLCLTQFRGDRGVLSARWVIKFDMWWSGPLKPGAASYEDGDGGGRGRSAELLDSFYYLPVAICGGE
jgi:hypothetical protein